MKASFRRLAVQSEPPARGELTVALVTLYAIVVTILACELVDRVRDTETKSTTPYTNLRTYLG